MRNSRNDSHRISNDMKTHFCPNCEIPLTGATGVETDEKPKKGDISICFACGEILEYGEFLTHQKISKEKLQELKDEAPDQYKMVMDLSNQLKEKKL